jgi:hypothetical protein
LRFADVLRNFIGFARGLQPPLALGRLSQVVAGFRVDHRSFVPIVNPGGDRS